MKVKDARRRISRSALMAGILPALVLLAASLVIATPAKATKVALGATVDSAGECRQSPGSIYTSTYCQIFAGTPLEIVAVASRDDGSVRLMPQPFTLLDVTGDRTRSLFSFTYFDENDADDDPRVRPRRNTDYALRFNGNEDIGPARSATMVVQVGARVAIPQRSSSNRGTRLRIPARVTLPWRSMRGRLQLRRCHRTKATSARSCARARDFTVLASRAASRSARTTFTVRAPARSMRRYEIVFVPSSGRYSKTRTAFTVTNGYDGVTTYRPTVRAAPFDNR